MLKWKESSRNFSLLGWLQAFLPYTPLPWVRLESAAYAWAHLQAIDSPDDLWRMLILQRIGRGAFPYSDWPANPGARPDSEVDERAEDSADSGEDWHTSSLLSNLDKSGSPPDIQEESAGAPPDAIADESIAAEPPPPAETVAPAARNHRRSDNAHAAPAGRKDKEVVCA